MKADARNIKCSFTLFEGDLTMSHVARERRKLLDASPFQHCRESPSQCNKVGKRNERHTNSKKKKEMKPSLFTEDLIVYEQNLK